ncbi:hypothetical protein BWR19_13740 [Halomonas sp. 1513]|nr:AI-2E family transporter [Halomonas sp. 1513]APX93913.1 hypothetical protein BWR19_13740 [Halomonas sp. 1513]
MSLEKRTDIHFSLAEKRLLRATVVALSSVILVGTIAFIVWVLGQVTAALHILVFPLAIAGVLALVLFPVVELLERFLHLRRLGAVILLFVILVGLFITLMVLVLPTAIYQGSQLLQSVPQIVERGHESLSAQFPTALPIVEDALAKIEIQSILPGAEETADRAMTYISFVVGLSFVPLYLFFALLSGHYIKVHAKSMLFLFTQHRQNEVIYLGQIFVDYVTAFFRGQLTVALIMGVMMAVGFTVIGLEAAIYFGLALGLLNIVPYLGFIIGVISVVPIAYLQPDGSGQLVLLVLAVIAVTQVVETMLLTPKIMAERSGLHPVLVVTSILFWGTVLGGVVGMILAVPLTAFLLTLGEHVKSRLRSTNPPAQGDRRVLAEPVDDEDQHR